MANSPGGNKDGLRVHIRKRPGRTESSRRWLERHFNDPYVKKAQAMGYRSRAAFKILELEEKLHILKPGAKIVDLGAAPGGWTQVATKLGCFVVALDILPMEPMPGAVVLTQDFMAEDAPANIIAELNGKADAVISDMAAPTTGHPSTDHVRIMALVEAAYDFARQILRPGGTFVAKVFQGGSERELLANMKRDFAVVKHIKPPASRKDSSETYVCATGFRG